jgi:hypothetical protein
VPPLLLHIFSLLLLVKATIIGLAPCALNAEFQHFIPIVNKISLLCGDTPEWWVWVEGRSKDTGWVYK